MTKVLVTGTPGSGKSTSIEALSQRGLAAYDADALADLVRLEIKASGEPVEWPPGPVDWDYYAWNLQEKPLLRLLDSNRDVFLGVSASNQAHFYHLFDYIFVLAVQDGDELRRRLEQRNVHKFGQTESDIQRAVAINPHRIAAYLAAGAIPIDHALTPEVAVDRMLEISHVSK